MNNGSCDQIARVDFGNVEPHGPANAARPDYWERCLEGIAALELPTDRPRLATLRPAFATELCSFSAGLSDNIRRLSREQTVEVATVVLAVFAVLLGRYTGQNNFVVATSPDAGLTLPVVFDFSDRPSFCHVLRRIEASLCAGRQAGAVPKNLAGRLGLEHDPSLNLICQVAFSSGTEGSPSPSPALSSGPSERALDLGLELVQSNQLTLRLHYNQHLFERATATRMLEHIQTLANGAMEDITRSCSEMPLLTARELRQQLLEWNNTARDYPHICLHALVEEMAATQPSETAVVYGREQLSYGELNRRANQLAHYLRKQGVGPNVRIGICLERSLEFAVALLGVLKTGAACVPLDPRYPNERLTFMLRDVQAPIVITEVGVLNSPVPDGTRLLHLSQESQNFVKEPHGNLCGASCATDVAYVLYTSGSTGRPRGVLLGHEGLVNYVLAAAKVYGLRSADRVLQFCSISFDAAVEEIFCTWAAGATLVFRTESLSLEVGEFLGWIGKQHVTVLDLPTAYWHEWVYAMPGLAQKVPPELRLVVVGGEKASPEAYSTWHSLVGNQVRWINTYGPTEASICATMYEPKLQAKEDPPAVLPIGRPVSNIRVYLLDPHLNPVPVGLPGELHIGGVGVALGYLNLPQLTEQKFIPDIFTNIPAARLYKTGDLARYLPGGEIEFLGRRDDQVKICGFRVELGEVESVLTKHSGVRDVAVVLHEDTPGNKRLMAYVVRGEQATASESELRRHVQNRLPKYMVPSEFVFLQSMPLTPNGKINRRALAKPKFDTPLPNTDTSSSDDPLQAKLIRIWEEVLGRKPIGVRDNFFNLGGHSLLAARLMYRIKQVSGQTLPLALLLQAPTVEELTALLRRNGWSHHWSSLVAIQPEGSKTPFFCVHGAGGNVVGFHQLAQHMKPNYPFYGLQAQGLDGKHACHARIEDMAAHYLNEVRTVQVKGPYQLGGFSLGGLVAYEMACQLLAQEEDVSLLVLFDTYAGKSQPVNKSLLSLLRRPNKERIQQLPRALGKKVRRTVRTWLLPEDLKKVSRTNARASERYQLRPYNGNATLLLAGDTWRESKNHLAAWAQLVRSLEVIEIPTSHHDMLGGPQVSRVAECLRGCIDKASLRPS